MHSRKLFFLVIFLLSCGGSSVVSKPTVSDLPNWVNDPHVNHPKSIYLVSVGVSDSKFEAETKAYEGIARIFGVDISGKETISTNVVETESELSKTVNLVNQLTLKTGQKVLNTKIEKIHLDPKSGQYYVLATLHKVKTSEVYVKQIEENKVQVDKWVDIYSKEKDPISQLGYLNKADQLVKLSNLLKQPLKVLGYYESEVNLDKTEKDIEFKRQGLINTIKVFVSAEDKTENSTVEAIKKSVTKSGLQVTSNKNDATIHIICKFNHEEIDLKQNNGTHFALWNFSANIMRTSNTSSFGVFTKESRTGQLNYNAAVKRSVFELNKHINKNFNSFFITKVFN